MCCARRTAPSLTRHLSAAAPLLPLQPWIVAGCGLVLAAAEAVWVAVQWRREAQQAAALHLAGAAPELQEALLSGGSAAVHQYLEP